MPPWARKFGAGSLSKIVMLMGAEVEGWDWDWRRRRASIQPEGPAPMMAMLNSAMIPSAVVGGGSLEIGSIELEMKGGLEMSEVDLEVEKSRW